MNKERVLIADDDKEILEALKRGLELDGFEVTTARDGMEALDILDRDTDFHCVVSDYQMPRATGKEVAEWCAKFKVPCVVASGDWSLSDRFDKIPIFFLRKPYSRDELKSAIDQARVYYDKNF